MVGNTERDWSLISFGGTIGYELDALPIALRLRVSYGEEENILTAEEPFVVKKTTDLSLLQYEMLHIIDNIFLEASG